MKENDSTPARRSTNVFVFIAYVFWGFFIFLGGLYLFFPRERLRERIQQELSLPRDPQAPPWATGMSVEIGEVDLHLWRPGIHLGQIRFTSTAPQPSGTNPTKTASGAAQKAFTVDALDLYFSWWDLLLGHLPPPKVEAELQAFGGQISLSLEQETSSAKEEKTKYQISFKSSPLQLAGIASGITSIPVSGTIEFFATCTVPADAKTKQIFMQKLDGSLQIKINGLTISDGKKVLPLTILPEQVQSILGTKLAQISPEGIPLPKLLLGNMNATIKFQKDKMTLDKVQFQGNGNPPDSRSVSLQLLLDGSVGLQDRLEASNMNTYLRVGPWKPLINRVLDLMKAAKHPEKEAALIKQIDEELRPLTDLIQMQERADGFLGFSIVGPLRHPLFNIRPTPPDQITLQQTTR